MAVMFFTTFVVPALGTYYMYRSGYISNMEVTERPERNMPFFFTAVCFAVTSYLFYQESYFDRLLFYTMSLITLSVFLTYLFSFFWKISAHSVGVGGTLGILILLNVLLPENFLLYIIIAAILMTGAVLSARLALDAHSTSEVYAGFILGISIGLGMWFVVA